MNQLYHGDNLDILRNIPDASIDLIATDPPFNTGKDWGAFDDRWEGGLTGYIKFMEVRCVEMRRVLKDTGSFYLHCDPTASHYLKVMLDSVFGIKQFRNEIVWWYHRMTGKSKYFQCMHDIILFFTKTSKYAFRNDLQPYKNKEYKNDTIRKQVNGKKGFLRDDNGNKIRRAIPYSGVRRHDVWHDVSIVSSTSKQRLGYPTQKPVALYERIIKASSNQGDTVLDPFAGSGTTLDASHTLGRHWIGIDSGEQAIQTIVERMRHRHGLEYDRDYEFQRG